MCVCARACVCGHKCVCFGVVCVSVSVFVRVFVRSLACVLVLVTHLDSRASFVVSYWCCCMVLLWLSVIHWPCMVPGIRIADVQVCAVYFVFVFVLFAHVLMWPLIVVACSALPRAVRGIRPAHPRDVPGWPLTSVTTLWRGCVSARRCGSSCTCAHCCVNSSRDSCSRRHQTAISHVLMSKSGGRCL